ncbi:uncharacterized protein LOC100370312 [Saccoglossus kowalevskii]|uniref:Uncharacterized protein LOC100370312 n=1 Tax=Saccoglossus kowalevskii TaxID=10224 RepID=A0ABM0MBI4_SACKO|nr:PREDICTED: uncharacterized protein LOC100370312 [Saccoglossus kowalevskii]
MATDLIKWLKKAPLLSPSEPNLLNPNNINDVEQCELSPEVVTVVNEEITSASRKRKRRNYQHYDENIRAKIGKYAVNNGVMNAARKFTKELGRHVGESRVRGMKQSYLKAIRSGKENVNTLPTTRGRARLLGSELDSKVQLLVPRLRIKRCC